MRYQQGDTIVAIATPPGEGGVGILRISGASALPIGQTLCGMDTTTPSMLPRHAYLRRFRTHNGQIIDHGIVLYFPAPQSYTGEDIVELQGHGSPRALAALEREAIALGARAARAGEFTERAFLNGRLDLAQAEAVADLIHARSDAQVRAAAASLEGAFSKAVAEIYGALLQCLALVEAGLDFSEEDLGTAHEQAITAGLNTLHQQLATLLLQAQQGARLAQGGRVVLIGRPNVGKSSLMNALAQRNSAIVTAVPGTTRDLLREEILLNGVPVELIDTAGLRESDDEVESEGIARARQILQSAQLILLIADASTGWLEEDAIIFQGLPKLPLLMVWNKIDKVSCTPPSPIDQNPVMLSARHGQGLDVLRARLASALGMEGAHCAFSARERHVEALATCLNHIADAQNLQQSAGPAELLAQLLREAATALGTITGRIDVEDILGEIFSRFCIGK